MGAVAGFLSYGSDQPELGPWQRALDALGGLGSAGLAECALAAGRGAMAHAYNAHERHDPIVGDPSGRYTAVVSARLDDRASVLSRLGVPESTSDSELILRAHLEWGPHGLSRLVGDFTFVVFDHYRAEFACVRDRVGIRPLFFAHSADGFFFASSLAILRLLRGIPSILDEAAFAARAARLVVSAEGTIFRGLRRLPPATVLSVSGSDVELKRYWQLESMGSSHSNRDVDWAAETRCTLTAAVHDRMRGRSGIGILLSGGLDSSSIAAIAQRRTLPETRVLIAASAVLPLDHRGAESDESEFIDSVVSEGGFDLVRREDQTGLDPLNAAVFAEALRTYGLPVNAYHAMDRALLGHLADAGAQVALTGFWGDATISFRDRRWLARRIRNDPWRELPAAVAAMAGFLGVPVRLLLYRELRGWVGAWREAGTGGASRFVRRHPLLANRMKQALTQRDDLAMTASGLPSETVPQVVSRGSQFVEEFYLAASSLGIEAAFPFLDVRVLELSAAVPAREFSAGGMTRSLLRRSMRDLLPAKVYTRTTKGAFVPGFVNGVRHQSPTLLAELSALTPSIRERISRVLDLDWIEARLVQLVEDRTSSAPSDAEIVTLAQGIVLIRFLAGHGEA